jgi:hypothetical protein
LTPIATEVRASTLPEHPEATGLRDRRPPSLGLSRPAARMAERLKLLRAEIDEQLADLDKPDRRLLRRQANKPVPIRTV